MKTISIDLETYSSADLTKCGVYKYCESPDFEILLFGYSVDGGEVTVIDLTAGEKIPDEVIKSLTDDSVLKFAFNANFERVCLSRFLGLPTGEYLNPSSWRCTMVWSAYMGLPLSLQGVGTVLNLEKQKLTEGKELIKYFCVPCQPTKANGGRTRNRPSDAPEKWERFKSYNIRDVETEMQIQQRLSKFPLPDEVWNEYSIDQEINDRGVRIDVRMVESAIAMDTRARNELTEKMKDLTDLENPNSVQQMRIWLADNGLETDTLGKKSVSEMLKTAPPLLSEALVLRQQLAKSSVKKYQAMRNAVCSDSRARGMFQFYGANRTGRFSGRLIQMQNLPQNHLADLAEARELVRSGNYDAVKMLYGDVPDTLSQLIRTAFIPRDNSRFYVADFSAIEARVIAWFAGEEWRKKLFSEGGDIYCRSASEMFGVPVVKNGVNGHLRQKGKIAELACIAENSLVLTNRGLVPIQNVRLSDLLWDGENWVSHGGVVYKGEREVITYEGLKATADHLVWVEGEKEPVQFGTAATSGAHLIQTGNGGTAIRLGENHIIGEKVENFRDESLLCYDGMHRMWFSAMADFGQSPQWKIKRLSTLFSTESNPKMDGQTINCSKAKMRKSKLFRISQLWRKRHTLRIFKCAGSRSVFNQPIWSAEQSDGDRQNRHKRKLRTWKSTFCGTQNKLCESKKKRTFRISSGVLALCTLGRNKKTVSGNVSGRNNSGCRKSCIRETEKLENNKRTARLYDIRNAGPHHRFTVSGVLVHNCGYGGSVGALKAMGAIDMGLQEEELKPLVDAWRKSNPNIIRFWWDVDSAVKRTVRDKTSAETHGLRFTYRSGMLFITLPSGRRLTYVKPKIGENQFGGESVTYEGIGATKKWERLESYGPKFVENIVQATARDILCYAMQTLRNCSITMHIHDELVIEAAPNVSLEAICEQMGRTPPWAEGLILRADGYVCDFYMKD